MAGRMPDSFTGTLMALGIVIFFPSDLLFRAHFVEAFLNNQLETLVIPKCFMYRVTEGAEGVFRNELQLIRKCQSQSL